MKIPENKMPGQSKQQKVHSATGLFPKGLPQKMELHVWFGRDLMRDALPDATLPFIQVWDQHWSTVACDSLRLGLYLFPILKWEHHCVNRYIVVSLGESKERMKDIDISISIYREREINKNHYYFLLWVISTFNSFVFVVINSTIHFIFFCLIRITLLPWFLQDNRFISMQDTMQGVLM